ncbi:dynein light chain tctex-type 1 protein (macronuclear) [Tetrahymena thermophila SB210]|uniref:Dynein light chain tctex-type 1 protein n=2 Tax=Tetrahymena thermophila TaxID=5911 RepID=I7M0N9_TETTS|nr:dynein light chain tctex-type 1 protein [Tetrahymena thermophila SB210]ABF22553.1 dynein light chain 2B [Tetrahymena thermophila]EAR89953.1 dynein light chain tctex-type 1 protein [Tetrahymena thermophila SB210]|eukprot:XP_001010198.1 dynein light chain tctex-type 1 protein [Tetrahymena thermophila SB210]
MKRGQGGTTNQEYQIRPKQREKFRPGKAKEIISETLNLKLKNQVYTDAATVSTISRDIADTIKYKLKDLGLPRYKFMVSVIIGQQKGQGVRVGSRQFWDFDTDYVASDYYVNDSLFCLVTVYGVYLY